MKLNLMLSNSNLFHLPKENNSYVAGVGGSMKIIMQLIFLRFYKILKIFYNKLNVKF